MQEERKANKQATIFPDCHGDGYPFEGNLFGINLEITRKGMFGGISAQMLNNRKLYMGTEGVDGWICDRFERVSDRPEESLCGSSFVILRDGSMAQSSEYIFLTEGTEYEAKVWIKAYSSDATVTFGVEGFEQTVAVVFDHLPYREFSFRFHGRGLECGTFRITVRGEVAVYEASLMPADHFYGMRWDVIRHLQTIAPTSLRFPGGCAADHFDWHECLKAPEFRKPADGRSKAKFLFCDTYHQDSMDIGLNEFFMLCRELGAEPECTVSLILSDGEDARRMVEYCNGDATTEYGKKRNALGFEPFNVHLWYIGNEAYFFGGKYQNSTLAANRSDELITAMKQADPSIAVAIGLTWREEFQGWAYDFMENLKSDFDYVSYHDYIGRICDRGQDSKGMASCDMLESNFADGECFGLNFYRNRLYADCFEKIRICVDEWNYSWGKTSSNALFFSNALQLHFFAKSKESYHVDRAEFFMAINEGLVSVRGELSKIESTGELFRLMAGHKKGRVIPCESDLSSLDILCTDHGDHLYISVINRGAEAVMLNVKDHVMTACTEIAVAEYSFESNEYEVAEREVGIIHGHSMSFLTVARQ